MTKNAIEHFEWLISINLLKQQEKDILAHEIIEIHKWIADNPDRKTYDDITSQEWDKLNSGYRKQYESIINKRKSLK